MANWFRSCNWLLMYCMWTFFKKKKSVNFYGICDKMSYSLYMWLAFICILLPLHSPWNDVWFNYVNMLQFIQMSLPRQRWLVSSCAQQTPWWKFQGTVDGHIPLPKRRYQQVCYWQPMDHQSHPIIKRICSKIHNYYCPLNLKRNSEWDETEGLKCNKKSHETKLYMCLLFVAVSLDS